METENNNQNGTKKGGVKVVIAISVIVILALVGVIIWLVMSKDKSEEQEKRNVVVTEDSIDEILEKDEEKDSVQPGYYTVTMNNVWHFKTGDSPSYDSHVENIDTNTNDVYFDIFPSGDDVDVENPDNAIYKSPIIPRGGKLEGVSLEKPLEPGSHECLLIYHLVDDEQKSVSTLRVTVTLVIEG